ncbi:DegT/DnrJ/EryC1/StrS family aminotransferase [bacterium]|nr:DegT/DnrJ/EryC1/StrS family aminotransferase [bacterium]
MSLLWYPPAETKLPIKALLKSLFSDASTAEKTLLRETGSKYCRFGPNGRSLFYSLLTALSKIAGPARNEVLIPGYTCYSVPAAVVKAGLKLCFYDLDPKTFAPKIKSLEQNCGNKTLAIISQHLLGIPTDTTEIQQCASKAGAYHIEDAAQAFGGRLDNRNLGTNGDFGFFSFGRGKSLPLGGGGALVSQRNELDGLLPKFKNNKGWKSLVISILTQPVSQPLCYGIAEKLPLGLGQTIFNPNFKPGATPISMVKLLNPMMAYLQEMISHRNTIASIYRNNIHPSHSISVPVGGIPVYPRYPMLARTGRLPNELLRMGVRRLYPNSLNHEPEINAYRIHRDLNLQGAETLAKHLVTLPTHHAINEKTAKSIAEKTNQWIDML